MEACALLTRDQELSLETAGQLLHEHAEIWSFSKFPLRPHFV